MSVGIIIGCLLVLCLLLLILDNTPEREKKRVHWRKPIAEIIEIEGRPTKNPGKKWMNLCKH